MAVAVDRETSRQSASQCFGGLKNAAGVQIMASFIHVDACVAVVPSQMARKLAKQHCKKEVKTTTKDVASAAPSPSKSALSRITVDAEIRDLLKSLLGENTIGMHAETPLNDLGMDSLSAVQFRRDLGNSVDLKLPSTFTFDHPTIRDIVEHIAPSQTRSPADGPSTTETGLALSMPSDSTYCALAASSNRCGDMSSKELLPALMWGSDIVIPRTFDSEDDSTPQDVAVHGSFLEQFEVASMFGISPAEASVMNPQQKVML